MQLEDEGNQDFTVEPGYDEGMAHLQAGEWQAAIRCFEELQDSYPDEAEIENALSEARFKASLDGATRVKGKRWPIRWRQVRLGGLLLAILVVVAVVALYVIRVRFLPAVAEAQEGQRLEQLESQAISLLEKGYLDVAEVLYNELLAAIPDHELAPLALEMIAEERQNIRQYDKAVALQDAGYVDAALKLFEELAADQPRFRDIALRIDQIEQFLGKDSLFAQAEAAFEAGQLEEAAVMYEAFKDSFAGVKGHVIDGRLYEIHMQLGRQLLEQDQPASELLPLALDHFRAALDLKPRDVDATLEVRLAELFLEGHSQYMAAQWELAIGPLVAVYDARPGYLRGMVAQQLYDAHVYYGDQLMEEGDCFLAHEHYREARGLPVEDKTLARAREVQVLACLTPTHTPALTATHTPTPTPTPKYTSTPKPARTPTPKPIKKPKKPKKPTRAPAPTRTPAPTSTPAPTATPAVRWTGGVTNQFQNCGLTRLFGFTRDRAGVMVGGIWVHYWGDGWDGAWAISSWYDMGEATPWQGDEGNWDGTVAGHMKDGTWHACVVPQQGSWECISNQVDVTTSSNCKTGIQVWHITFREN